jgi:hypothetical protein
MDHEAGISEVVYVDSARALAQQRAFTGSRPGAFGWIAAVAFTGIGGLLLAILWPRQEWQATPSSQRVLDNVARVDGLVSLESVHRDMALHMERAYTMNQRLYASLASYFRAAAVLLSVEVLAWICDLATKA